MLGHHCKVEQVVVGVVLHVMAMAHRTIVALACAALLHLTVVVEGGGATDDIYYLAVFGMRV